MSKILDRPTLVLNRNWQAINVAPVSRALIMVWNDAARVVDPSDYQLYDWESWAGMEPLNGEPFVQSVSQKIKAPEVVTLVEYGDLPSATVTFSRRNIFKRDRYTCFIPETLVTMSDLSLKRIDQVKVGETVIDAFGNTQTVEFVNVKSVSEELLEIRLRGLGMPLVCTKDHKMLLYDKEGSLISSEGVAARAVGKTSRMAELRLPLGTKDRINISAYVEDCHVHDGAVSIKRTCPSKKLPDEISLTREFGRLIGYFLAKGCICGRTVVFTFNINAYKEIEDTANILKKVFGLEATIKPNSARNTCVVRTSSVALCDFLKGFLYPSGDKRFLHRCFCAEFLRGVLAGTILGVLAGTILGDGYIRDDKIDLGMGREDLILDLKILCNQLGMFPTLSKTYFRDGKKPVKHLIFQGEELPKLRDICRLPWLPTNKKADKRIFSDGVVRKVLSVKEVPYSGDVYDLQVSGSHTYVANFVCVHNCQYCGKQPGADELTIDHVVPRAQGGESSWTNCVLACLSCNMRKADRTPKQAHLRLRKIPSQPVWKPHYSEHASKMESWSKFISDAYWNARLES